MSDTEEDNEFGPVTKEEIEAAKTDLHRGELADTACSTPTDELQQHSILAAEARSLLHNGKNNEYGPNDTQRSKIDAILREICGIPKA